MEQTKEQHERATKFMEVIAAAYYLAQATFVSQEYTNRAQDHLLHTFANLFDTAEVAKDEIVKFASDLNITATPHKIMVDADTAEEKEVFDA